MPKNIHVTIFTSMATSSSSSFALARGTTVADAVPVTAPIAGGGSPVTSLLAGIVAPGYVPTTVLDGDTVGIAWDKGATSDELFVLDGTGVAHPGVAISPSQSIGTVTKSSKDAMIGGLLAGLIVGVTAAQ